jgi:hypothetical protein
MVMHDNARNVRQQAAAPGRDPIEGEQHGAGDVQPLRLAANAEAGLVHMLDRCRCHLVTHGMGEALKALSAAMTDPGDRRRGQPHAEQVGHQHGEALLGH